MSQKGRCESFVTFLKLLEVSRQTIRLWCLTFGAWAPGCTFHCYSDWEDRRSASPARGVCGRGEPKSFRSREVVFSTDHKVPTAALSAIPIESQRVTALLPSLTQLARISEPRIASDQTRG